MPRHRNSPALRTSCPACGVLFRAPTEERLHRIARDSGKGERCLTPGELGQLGWTEEAGAWAHPGGLGYRAARDADRKTEEALLREYAASASRRTTSSSGAVSPETSSTGSRSPNPWTCG